MTATDDQFDAWFHQAIQPELDATDTCRLTEALEDWATNPCEQRRIANLADILDAEDALGEEPVVTLEASEFIAGIEAVASKFDSASYPQQNLPADDWALLVGSGVL